MGWKGGMELLTWVRWLYYGDLFVLIGSFVIIYLSLVWMLLYRGNLTLILDNLSKGRLRLLIEWILLLSILRGHDLMNLRTLSLFLDCISLSLYLMYTNLLMRDLLILVTQIALLISLSRISRYFSWMFVMSSLLVAHHTLLLYTWWHFLQGTCWTELDLPLIDG